MTCSARHPCPHFSGGSREARQLQVACSPTFSSGCSVWNRNNSTENVDCPCAYHQWVKRASSDLLAGFRALPPLLVCPVPVLWKFLVPSLSLLVRMEPSPSFHPISLGTPSLSCLCSQWPLSSRYPPLQNPTPSTVPPSMLLVQVDWDQPDLCNALPFSPFFLLWLVGLC